MTPSHVPQELPRDTPVGQDPRDSRRPTRWRKPVEVARALVRQPAGVIGLIIVGVVVVCAVVPSVVAPYNPLSTDVDNLLSGMSAKHWLGTDEVGRDILSRLVYGARPAILVGMVATLVGGVLGVSLGIAAAYFGKAFAAIVMRIADTVFAFPLVLIGVALVLVFGSGVASVGIAVGVGVTPIFIRLAWAEANRELVRDYVLAARGLGAGAYRILLRHVVPNIVATLIVQVGAVMSDAVVLAAALDFLGFGVQPPAPSWGAMLQESRDYLTQSTVFAVSPGVVLTLFIVGVNVFAVALTNAVNPRIRSRLIIARSRARGTTKSRARYRAGNG